MILPNINHKMPIYNDCTLGELLTIGSLVFVALTFILGCLTHLLWGLAWIGFTLTTFLLVPITKLLLRFLQQLKYGKPYGYYQHIFMKQLIHRQLIKPLYVIRTSRWSTRRFYYHDK